MAYTKQTWQDSPNTTTPITAARLSHIEDGIEANSNAIEALGGGVTVFTAQYAQEWVESEDGDEIIEFQEWVFRLTNGATPYKVSQALDNGQLPVLKYVIQDDTGAPWDSPTVKCAYFARVKGDSAYFKTDTAEIRIRNSGISVDGESPIEVTFTGTL